MAASAMSHAGVDETALRQRVAALYPTKTANKKINRVPFSAEAKKCMELSLREAHLGHSYIGTEHLFFGVQRQAAASDGTLTRYSASTLA